MIPVARKNLLHHKTRLFVALGGVVFGVVLTLVQLGILLGFLNNSTKIIDTSPADLWIVAPGTQNQDMTHPLPESVVERAECIPGVDWAEQSLLGWSTWKGNDGSAENIQIIGVKLDGRVGIPYKVDKETASKLREPGTVLLDRAECARLNVWETGTEVELFGRRAKIVGFTEGGRAFTTAPIITTTYERAKEYLWVPLKNKTLLVHIKVKEGNSVQTVQQRLRKSIDGVEVLTSAEFRFRSKFYWLVTTGVGTGFLIAAIMGLIIGGAVVAQVLYANVVEHLKEFAVMKALGAGPGRLVGILLEQSLYIGVGGCALGIVIAAGIGQIVIATHTPMWIPWQLAAVALVVTVLFCMASTLVPARMLLKLEPASVFMG